VELSDPRKKEVTVFLYGNSFQGTVTPSMEANASLLTNVLIRVWQVVQQYPTQRLNRFHSLQEYLGILNEVTISFILAYALYISKRRKEMKSKNMFSTLLMIVIMISAFTSLATVTSTTYAQPSLLDPDTIPKFVNQLTGPPPVYTPKWIKNPNGTGFAMYYEVTMSKSAQQILPTVDEYGNPTGFGLTEVWGYGGLAQDAITGKPLGYVLNSPGPTFEAIRGVPTIVKWVNNISAPYMFVVDPTLHWADPTNPQLGTMRMWDTFPTTVPGIFSNSMTGATVNAQTPVPLVTHLHGGEVQSLYDGHPEAWMTYGGLHGPAYNTLYPTDDNAAVFYYPNEQPPTTLWYHDHGLGVTRLNVMSGLAGFYLLRDYANPIDHMLAASGAVYEMPLAIQDRTFQADGNFYFPAGEPTNQDVHPYWSPEFFGDTIMVNGLVWPNMDVNRGIYRFRLLDGSNARFYNLTFVDMSTGDLLPFTQIGTDGGYMKSAVTMSWLQIAPGERADVLVDFGGLQAGTKILMKNSANAPFPDGDPVDENTAQIMQFTVTSKLVRKPLTLPNVLNKNLAGAWPTLPSPTKVRYLTLYEVEGEGGPLEVLVNGQKWSADISENVTEGSTEEWVIINLTMDTHPIHTHLTQFQLVSRIPIDIAAYTDAWVGLNGEPPFGPGDPIPIEIPLNSTTYGNFITGSAIGPTANEYAWKDTIQMNPGQATIIRIRFSPIDGSTNYPFDPTIGPGYVWHCHILDHEDNEMMRPYLVVP
jgi:spore coat protein A